MPAGSWLFSLFATKTSPDDWLAYHRSLRNLGTYAVIVGVIAETLIDELWEIETPPLLRGPKATTALKTKAAFWKKCLMLFVGVAMVGGGIIVEIWQGGMADDVVDAIRADQQQQIALATERAVDAEDRAANASIEANASNERAVRLLRIESDRQVIVYSDAFDKLRAFKNISVWVNVAGATIKTLSDRNLDQSLRPQIFQQLEEKGRFASTFDALKAVGWNVTVLSPNDPRAIYMPAGPDADAVTVYSRGPEDVWQCDDTPYAVATNTPEMNECAAAGALAKYLSAIGAGPARHSSVDRYVSLPKGMPSDAILVMIGAHNTPAALEDEERSLESAERERRREELRTQP